jgi:hypothetical protein
LMVRRQDLHRARIALRDNGLEVSP